MTGELDRNDNPFAAFFSTVQEESSHQAQVVFNGEWAGVMLGTMVSGLKLQLDHYAPIIEEYYVSHHLTLAEPDMTGTEVDGFHADPIGGTHSHQVITPKELLPLHDGDRVSVFAINKGQDFWIADRIYKP